MHYLHTMVRVQSLEQALDFYVTKLGLEEVSRKENEKGKFTLMFLKAPGDEVEMDDSPTTLKLRRVKAPLLELTYNWDEEKYTGGRNFGHLAYAVENIYDYCKRLMDPGVVINRPPRDGRMAFIRSPDGISIELLQIGESLALQEPWQSMPNTGEW